MRIRENYEQEQRAPGGSVTLVKGSRVRDLIDGEKMPAGSIEVPAETPLTGFDAIVNGVPTDVSK